MDYLLRPVPLIHLFTSSTEAYAWHELGVEATVTYRCPECHRAYDKEGNRLERSLIAEELGL
jgi:hypothetical protein